MVVDIGGGTVDISAYCIRLVPEPHLQILLPPSGNAYGGAIINEKFMCFLEELIEDKGFARYIQTTNKILSCKHMADLQSLCYTSFEEQKKIFGKKRATSDDSRRLSIKLPATFVQAYENSLRSANCKFATVTSDPPQLEFVESDGSLRITYNKMEEFYTPVVDGILECISQTLESMDGSIEALYLVGGFGGSQYLYEKIKAQFGPHIKYVVPRLSDAAVVEGAVLQLKNPDVVHSRKADSTYGIRVSLPFDAKKHDEEHKSRDEADQEVCNDLFSTVAVKGDTVNTNEVFKSTHSPENSMQRQMNIQLYSSQKADVKYTTEPHVQKIGELIIPLPILETSPEGSESEISREVDIYFDFTYSELQVMAFDHGTQKQVKCVLDFLSSV